MNAVMFRTYSIFMLFIFAVSLQQGCDHLPGDTPQEMNLTKWEEDVRTLIEDAKSRNIALTDPATAQRFETEGQQLLGKLSDLTRSQIEGELFRLVAGIQSGHTHVELLQKPLDFDWLPFVAYQFEDGIYIIAAGSGYESLVGAKLLEVNGHDLETVKSKLAPFIAAENDQYRTYLLPLFLSATNFLRAAGLSSGEDAKFQFTIEHDGARETVTIEPGSVRGIFSLHSSLAGSHPLELAILPSRLFYQEYDATTRTLFVRINQVLNDGSDQLSDFAQQVSATIEANEIDRFVLDLRFNSGGNNLLGIPLANVIKNSPRVNQSGKLFVLVGRQTFSAALDLATRILRTTKAVLVGEPTGGAPNSFGESAKISLPNSRIRVAHSTRKWVNGMPGGTEPAVVPDLHVQYSYSDYKNRKDPAMEAVRNYSVPARTPRQLSNEILTSYEGTYLLNDYQKLVLSQTENGLHARVVDCEDFLSTDLYAVSETMFESDIRGLTVSLVRGRAKEQPQAILSWNGLEQGATRASNDYLTPWDLLQQGKITEGVNRLSSARGAWLDSRFELYLNNLGYALLGKKEYTSSIEVMQLNVTLFSLSANSYDSLGEAYFVSGDKQRAKENYEKSLHLNPENDNAADYLKQLN